MGFSAVTIALALFFLSSLKLIASDGLLGVFAAAVVFSEEGPENLHEESKIDEVANHFFMLPVFTIFGLSLPWESWSQLGGRQIVLLIGGTFLFRRLIFVLALWPVFRGVKNFRQAMFIGWFGPIGIASLYYALFLRNQIGREGWAIVSLCVFASIIVHGVSSSFLTKRY